MYTVKPCKTKQPSDKKHFTAFEW